MADRGVDPVLAQWLIQNRTQMRIHDRTQRRLQGMNQRRVLGRIQGRTKSRFRVSEFQQGLFKRLILRTLGGTVYE